MAVRQTPYKSRKEPLRWHGGRWVCCQTEWEQMWWGPGSNTWNQSTECKTKTSGSQKICDTQNWYSWICHYTITSGKLLLRAKEKWWWNKPRSWAAHQTSSARQQWGVLTSVEYSGTLKCLPLIPKWCLFDFLQLKQSLEQERTETSNKQDSPFYEVVGYTVKNSQVGTEAIELKSRWWKWGGKAPIQDLCSERWNTRDC